MQRKILFHLQLLKKNFHLEFSVHKASLIFRYHRNTTMRMSPSARVKLLLPTSLIYHLLFSRILSTSAVAAAPGAKSGQCSNVSMGNLHLREYFSTILFYYFASYNPSTLSFHPQHLHQPVLLKNSTPPEKNSSSVLVGAPVVPVAADRVTGHSCAVEDTLGKLLL